MKFLRRPGFDSPWGNFNHPTQLLFFFFCFRELRRDRYRGKTRPVAAMTPLASMPVTHAARLRFRSSRSIESQLMHRSYHTMVFCIDCLAFCEVFGCKSSTQPAKAPCGLDPVLHETDAMPPRLSGLSNASTSGGSRTPDGSQDLSAILRSPSQRRDRMQIDAEPLRGDHGRLRARMR